MAVRVSVEVTNDGGREFLVQLDEILTRPRALHAALGSRLQDELTAHFLRRNDQPNKRNWPKTGFWGEIAGSTQLESVSDSGAVVTVADRRFGIHVTGGTVRPREAEALTIPIHPLARGRFVKTLEEETGLKVFRPGKGDSSDRPNILAVMIGDELTPVYALAKSATIPRDADALPSDALMLEALTEEASDWLDAELRRGGAA